MPKWLISGWSHGLISLATSTGSAVAAFYGERHHLIAQHTREDPYDGLVGLDILIGPIAAAIVTFCGVFLFSLILQRVLTGSLSFKNN